MSAAPIRVLLISATEPGVRTPPESQTPDRYPLELFNADSNDNVDDQVRQAGIHLVLFDLKSSNDDAMAAISRLAWHESFVPIVVLAETPHDERVQRAMASGARGFVAMPSADVDSLLQRLRRDSTDNALEIGSGATTVGSVAVTAHDLRTPLTSIRLISEYLLSEAELDKDVVEHFLRMSHAEVLRMNEILDNVLEAARLESGVASGTWSTVALASVCHEAMDVVRPLAAAKALDLEVQVEPNDLTLQGDRIAIRRLLVNLASNAVRHTSSGRILIRATAEEHDGHPWVVLSVCDTGQGIPESVLRDFGKPFVSTSTHDTVLAGTGLGIGICQRIAAIHGGSLSATSAIGSGSVFSVRLRADLPRPAKP